MFHIYGISNENHKLAIFGSSSVKIDRSDVCVKQKFKTRDNLVRVELGTSVYRIVCSLSFSFFFFFFLFLFVFLSSPIIFVTQISETGDPTEALLSTTAIFVSITRSSPERSCTQNQNLFRVG